MVEHKYKEEVLQLIRAIENSSPINQRGLSKQTGFSLGKTNYLLKELIKKGLIRVAHFTTHPGRLRKISYAITPEGIEAKIQLVKHFLERKEAEYNSLRNEWIKLQLMTENENT